MTQRQFSYLRSFIALTAYILLFTGSLLAQDARQYRIANQFMQAGHYEQACSILEKLYQKDPKSYPVYDHLVTCLVNLKNYDEAIKITKNRLGKGYKNLILAARLGELYHMKGDTTDAMNTWNNALEANKSQIQTYRYLAETLSRNQEYRKATDIFKRGRQYFHNNQLFIYEMAANYLQAGEYDKSVMEYLNLLKTDTNRLGFVENQLIRYDDQYLYDAAIAETEEIVDSIHPDNEYKQSLNQLLIWLYIERGFYSKALMTAKRLDKISNHKNFPVFHVGLKLESLNRFTLAREAFSYYASQKDNPLAARSLEEIARLDVKWADFYDKYHLDFGQKTDSLYDDAYRIIDHLTQDFPNYDGKNAVLTLRAELALNHIKNVKAASEFVRQLEKLPGSQKNQAMINYLRGRINLFEGNFDMARVYFTRSNKEAHAGMLADKTRYYLSLTDFYAGDYKFAKIQIKALEANSTSLYANNALQLRVWIQDGEIRDSTTAELRSFSKAQLLDSRGDTTAAIDTLLPYLESPYRHPLKDAMMLFVIKLLKNNNPVLAFALSDQYLESGSGILLEQIVWENAQLANQIHSDSKIKSELMNTAYHFPVTDYFTKHNIPVLNEKTRKRILEIVSAKSKIIKLYESLLIQYPSGFFAEYARNQIRSLQQENAS